MAAAAPGASLLLRPTLRRLPPPPRAAPAGSPALPSDLSSALRRDAFYAVPVRFVPLRARMEAAAAAYLQTAASAEAAADPTALEELVAEDVELRDPVAWGEERFVGRRRLAAVLRDYGRAYPNLAYRVLAVLADESSGVALAHWQASGAHLSAPFQGLPPTGCVSSIAGMTRFDFEPLPWSGASSAGSSPLLPVDRTPRIRRITVYRTILAEERAAFAADVPDFE